MQPEPHLTAFRSNELPRLEFCLVVQLAKRVVKCKKKDSRGEKQRVASHSGFAMLLGNE